MSSEIDLSRPRRIHIVGVGGAGMSAIAEVLAGSGHTVSGSDMVESRPLARLREQGLTMSVGHDAANIAEAEFVAISTAIPATNPEVVAAGERGVPVYRRAELLAAMTRRWQTVAVAGTHGKTTTSAMLAAALIGAGLDPAYLVGGDLKDTDRGADVGSGEFLVVEADESDGTFVELDAAAAIVTNVEPDHLEHYGDFAGLEQAFERFIRASRGPAVICVDDPGSARLARSVADRPGVVTYGTVATAEVRIVDPLPTPVGIEFGVVIGNERATIRLHQPGMHNALNATAALAMAHALGADIDRAAAALSAFGGVGRRFEVRGQHNGIQLIDDYAHLPTEVSFALAAAKSLEPRRLVAVFQPHRYSRTEQLWSTFADAFVDADVLIVTGIYAAGEAPRPGITGQLIADVVARNHPGRDVRYIADLDEVIDTLAAELRAGDLCLTLGAGDLTRLPDHLLAMLQR